MIVILAALLLISTQSAREPVLVPIGTHPYAVSSGSMAPTLVEGEVIVANRPRGDCGTTDPALGDVVIVDQDGEFWVRRVVAGPGQAVQMIDGALHVDDVPVANERVEAEPPSAPEPPDTIQTWRETLPGGRSYLTWDIGPSRIFDNTHRLIVPAGHWFTLGDNRDNSIDDRADGPTPASALCGIALQIVRSNDPARVGVRP